LNLAEGKHGNYLQYYAYEWFSKLKQFGIRNKYRNGFTMTRCYVIMSFVAQLNKQVQA